MPEVFTVAVGVVSVISSTGVVGFARRYYGQWIGSLLVGTYTEEADRRVVSTFRTDFHFGPIEGFKSRGNLNNHAHVPEADRRCQATTSFDTFVSDLAARHPSRNYKRYDESTSTREIKFAPDGTRLVYGDSDLGKKVSDDNVEPNHFVTMIDVDYYLDNFGKYYRNPMLLYTVIPTGLRSRCSNTIGGYLSPDVYEERVAGEHAYKSSLWNYNPDLVRVDHRNRFGFSFGFSISHVEKVRQPGSKDRYAVLVAPKVVSSLPYWLHRLVVAACGMDYDYGNVSAIERSNNVMFNSRKDFLIGRFTDANGHPIVQLCDVNNRGSSAATLSEELFCVLTRDSEIHGEKWTQANCARTMGECPSRRRLGDDHRLDAKTVWMALRDGAVDPGRLNVNYQKIPDGKVIHRHDTGKPTAKLIGVPLVCDDDLGCAPVAGPLSDEACVKGRILDVANDKIPSAQFEQFAEEFTDQVASIVVGTTRKKLRKAKGTPTDQKVLHGITSVSSRKCRIRTANKKQQGLPVTVQEVDDNQTAPTQRRRREEDDLHIPLQENNVKAMQKGEAYDAAKDPRNISTVTTTHTRDLSRFAYAFSDHLKEQFGPKSTRGTWMLPGSNPRATSRAVHQFVKDCCAQVVETDYSRFDGRISRWLREKVEFAALLKWVDPRYQEELLKLLKNDIAQRAKTKHGIKYNTEGSRLSGSPLTTVGNTLINAFVVYCALRIHFPGWSIEDCIRGIGPKYGDDGIDMAELRLDWVASELGLKLKIVSPKLSGRVAFLGRYFYNAEYSGASHFDVPRALRKMNIIINGPRPHADSFRLKLQGYLITDPCTPVLSAYCRASLRVNGWTETTSKSSDGPLTSEERFRKSALAPWPVEVDAGDGLLAESVGLLLGMTGPEVVALDEKLESVTTVEELRKCRFAEPLPGWEPDGYDLERIPE